MSVISTELDGTPPGRPDGEGYGIIVLSHLRWSFVWQRPQQLLSRFAEQSPVLFVEEPDHCLEPGSPVRRMVEEAQEGVTVLRLELPRDFGRGEAFEEACRQAVQDTIAAHPEASAFERPLLWYYTPMDVPWSLGKLNERGVVYDCMDELSQFRFAPAKLVELEDELLNAAEVVFTGGYELGEKKRRKHPNVHVFGCGVEYEHFAKADRDDTEVPDEVKDLSGPVLGWFGVIDERVDYDLLARIAAERPDWHVVMVGPVVKVDPKDLPQAANIHWLGQRDYKELPGYCKAFDVCMMCFALNEATEFINPTKALEYLATGRPVLSTAVRDVVRQYSEYVTIAKSHEQFIAYAEELLATPDSNRIAAGKEFARERGWGNAVAQMKAIIRESLVGELEAVEA